MATLRRAHRRGAVAVISDVLEVPEAHTKDQLEFVFAKVLE
jgi:hypothetical protein